MVPGQGGVDGAGKAVCAGCPARALCLEYAVETDAAGVWGGTSEKERRAMLRHAS